MARYRATAKMFVTPRPGYTLLVRAGEEFDMPDGAVPGRAWSPIDAAAREAMASAISPAMIQSGAGSSQEMFRLAESLGAPKELSIDAARSFIQTWKAENGIA